MRLHNWIVLLLSLILVNVSFAQESVRPQDLADENGQFVMVDGVELYYVSAGEVEDPAVILIHGFGGSTFSWRDTLQPLAEAGFYVIALDLPPFGLSDKHPTIGYSRTDYAKYIAGFMDHLEIESATVIGHSMGGAVAAQFTVDFNQRVDKLVLVAAALFIEEPTRDAAQEESTSPLGPLANIDLDNENAAAILRRILQPTVFTGILRSAYFNRDVVTADVVEGYQRPLQIETWPEGFIGYLRANNSDAVTAADLASRLANSNIPVLIQWGQEDSWVPLSVGQALAEVLPGSTFITYEATGHLPMEESVEAFNADLIAFLND